MESVRVLLKDRVNGNWTLFESTLFNLVTAYCKLGESTDFLFSNRLRITQAMVDAANAEVALIEEGK